jgi:hypothetical protein
MDNAWHVLLAYLQNYFQTYLFDCCANSANVMLNTSKPKGLLSLSR